MIAPEEKLLMLKTSYWAIGETRSFKLKSVISKVVAFILKNYACAMACSLNIPDSPYIPEVFAKLFKGVVL